jgi:hypothetical protein
VLSIITVFYLNQRDVQYAFRAPAPADGGEQPAGPGSGGDEDRRRE